MDTSIVPRDKRSRTPADYHALANYKGFQWVGSYTGKVTDLTTWKCSQGHLFDMAYSVLRKPRYGCPKCHRYQPEDYHVRAARFGHTWLGPEVRNTTSKTAWRCAHGHEWKVSFQSLTGCPVCTKNHRGDSSRHEPSAYLDLATGRGYCWLGPEVKSAASQTWWQCSHGHKWQATYSTIRSGRGCSICDNLKRGEARRIKPDQYHQMAESSGLIWLGPEVDRVRDNTWWQCMHGHKWCTAYSTLKKGASCPECQDLVNSRLVSKPQRLLCTLVDGVLNYKVGRCTVDVAVFSAEAKIGIEYDCYYWHGKTQSNDYRRAQYMVRRGWKILSVKANGQLPTMEQINDAFAALIGGKDYHEIVLDDWGKGKVRT